MSRWGYWTKERVIESAKKHHYKFSWKKAHSAAYAKARINGWLEEACSHMVSPIKPQGYWTEQRILLEAKKYNTRKQFEDGSSVAHTQACKLGILQKACKHMPAHAFKRISDIEVVSDSKNFKTKNEWKHFGKHYQIALKRPDLYEMCTSHMPESVSSSTEELNLLNEVKCIFPDAKKKRFLVKDEKRNYELDIFIPSIKLGIEYDGTYYHSFEGLKKSRKDWSKEDLENYHTNKDAYFKRLGIDVVHIKEVDYRKDKRQCYSNIVDAILVQLRGTSL